MPFVMGSPSRIEHGDTTHPDPGREQGSRAGSQQADPVPDMVTVIVEIPSYEMHLRRRVYFKMISEADFN
jgi:hypothetical protein